jgi:hypothetical protein
MQSEVLALFELLLVAFPLLLLRQPLVLLAPVLVVVRIFGNPLLAITKQVKINHI